MVSEKAVVLSYLSFHFPISLESSCAKINWKVGGVKKELQSPGGAQGKSDPTLHLPTPHARREPFPVTVSFCYCSRFICILYPLYLGFSARDENKLISGRKTKAWPH